MAAFADTYGVGDKLQAKDGVLVNAAEVLHDKIVGLYFSAHWCPPCRGFTPKLVEFYNKLKASGKAFEIVFVSSDKDEGQFKEYFAEMPWLSLPFSYRDLKNSLSKKYKVSGIPHFVILDTDGEVICKVSVVLYLKYLIYLNLIYLNLVYLIYLNLIYLNLVYLIYLNLIYLIYLNLIYVIYLNLIYLNLIYVIYLNLIYLIYLKLIYILPHL